MSANFEQRMKVAPVIDEVMGENIQQGIYWLNTNVPGWYKQINLTLLDMESSNLCVLGQIFGSFQKGTAQLGVGPRCHSSKLVIMGFESPLLLNPEEDLPAYYIALTIAWKEQIALLKEERNVVNADPASRQLIWRKKSTYIPSYIQSHLPYIIHRDYQRLVRLVRYLNRAERWHSPTSQCMMAAQCERLHLYIYGSYCYYGAFRMGHLPSYIKGQGIVEASSRDDGGDK